MVKFHKQFENVIDAVEGQWGESHPMKLAQQNNKCNGKKDEIEQKCWRQFMACSFSHGANRKCCSKCVEESNDMCPSGSDTCPKLIEKVMTCLFSLNG